MLKFKTLCAVLAYLSSDLLNEVGLSLFRYFEVGLRVCDIVVKKFTFAISSPDEFLCLFQAATRPIRPHKQTQKTNCYVQKQQIQKQNITKQILKRALPR